MKELFSEDWHEDGVFPLASRCLFYNYSMPSPCNLFLSRHCENKPNKTPNLTNAFVFHHVIFIKQYQQNFSSLARGSGRPSQWMWKSMMWGIPQFSFLELRASENAARDEITRQHCDYTSNPLSPHGRPTVMLFLFPLFVAIPQTLKGKWNILAPKERMM